MASRLLFRKLYLLTLCSLLGTLAAAPQGAAAVIQRSIAIDADMLDWAPVLVNPQNYAADLSTEQGDLDNPNSSDRDLRAFAFTYDASSLYFYFRRTFGANNSITFLVYIDLDHDGVLTSADRIVRYDFNGATASTRELRAYAPAGPADPLTGDGVDEPGGVGALLPATLNSAATPSGIEVECSIAWTSLNPPAGARVLAFHASSATGTNLPGQVQDNVASLDSQYAVVRVDADGFRVGGTPATLRYSHTVMNLGNGSDRFDLTTSSARGWSVSLWSDPDGDGDPADGQLMGIDENGDGDFGDALDTPPTVAWDSNGNGRPDTGVLAPGGILRLIAELSVPAGVGNGTQDTVAVYARSALDLGVVARNLDTAVIGKTTLSPDREKRGVAGTVVDIPHQACNFGGFADVLDVAVSTTLGWSAVPWSDPDGDGDPGDGAPLSDTDGDSVMDTGRVSSGTCVSVVLRVSIPPGTPSGTRDALALTATSSLGYGQDSVADGVTAAARVSFDPDRSHTAIPGEVIYAPHVITNGGGLAESYDLLASAPVGWNVVYWSDPNCDGRTDDGRTVTFTDSAPASGGTVCVIAQIRVPAGAAIGSTSAITSTARSQTAPAMLDTVSDSIFISRLRTYTNPLLTIPSATFYRCGTVYAGGGGLTPASEYRFVWEDADLGDGPERTSPGFTADDTGRADDRYLIQLADAVGSWSVKLQIKQGASWSDVAPQGSFNFQVLGDADSAGTVSFLQTDRFNYAVNGDTLRVTAEIQNLSPVHFYRDSILDYVVFRDADGDGLPDLGEPYIRGDGTSGPWIPGAVTRTRTSISVYPYERVFDSWQVANVQFGFSAIWSVYAAWRTGCATPIAAAIIDFSVGCAVAPTASAGPDREICPGGSTLIGTPGEPRRSYQWSPGLGLSNAGVPEPLASPAATTTYSLTVTDVDTACTAVDSVAVTVRTPPAPDIAPNAPEICIGASIVLDAGAGFSSYQWSTTETTASISVAPLATTTYSVSVTDGFGCAGGSTETVVVHPLPSPDVTPDAPAICAGESIALDAGAGYSEYSWSTGDATRTITVSPATSTSYTASVRDGNGCWNSAGETVTVNPLPAADIRPDAPAICAGQSIALDAGAGFASYLWSTGETTRTIVAAPSATTRYDATVEDGNGCRRTVSETVSVNPLPSPDILPSRSNLCPGDSATLDAGAGYSSYLWSTGETTRTITVSPSATTTYGVTVADAAGCTGTASETLSVLAPPSVTPVAPETCAGSPVTLDAGPGYASYLWSTGETTRSISVAPAATQSYDVTVTDGSGCQATATTSVLVHALPTPAVVPASAETCPGAAVTLDAGAGYSSYRWLSGETTRTIVVAPSVTTTYSVVVGDSFGCEASASATVTVRPQPVYPPQSIAGCVGAPVLLDGGAGFTGYRWSTGETTRTITVVVSGPASFNVDLTDASGCSGAKTFNLTAIAAPAVDAGADLTICPGLQATLGTPSVSGLVYSWSPSAGLSDPGRGDPTFTAGTAGTTTYTVTVLDPTSGCSSTDSVTVTVSSGAPEDDLGNVLLLAREGSDVHHYWTGKPGLQRHDLRWSADKSFAIPGLVVTTAAGVVEHVEAGAVPAPFLRHYRVTGDDCPPGSSAP